jgi:hypothetical protein
VPRTPEQIAADDNLTAAIEQCMRAHFDEEHPAVLTEYLVITSQRRWDEDGDAITAVGVIFREDNVPLHNALGLVEYVGAQMRRQITE